jgi:hypothetical protein
VSLKVGDRVQISAQAYEARHWSGSVGVVVDSIEPRADDNELTYAVRVPGVGNNLYFHENELTLRQSPQCVECGRYVPPKVDNNHAHILQALSNADVPGFELHGLLQSDGSQYPEPVEGVNNIDGRWIQCDYHFVRELGEVLLLQPLFK